MKASEVTLLCVGETLQDHPEHWLQRWQKKLRSALALPPLTADITDEKLQHLFSFLHKIIEQQHKPIIFVTHGRGVYIAIKAAQLYPDSVKGGFFVAPTEKIPENLKPFFSHEGKLPFPSLVIASTDDAQISCAHSQTLANRWGSLFLEAGKCGHFDDVEAFGPWPEGGMVFAQFLTGLKEG